MAVEREDMIAEVDLMENAVYRVKDGQIEKIDTPPKGFGKQLITWQDNKPFMWEVSYTSK
ncbi:DUF3954 domain-containing protein [Planococcus rifietoensis]|uniref:DUF3954 domain-containing protein n=1 Tax=Planococcus rifietoensis TaxID=200991 RepID=UPI00384B483B